MLKQKLTGMALAIGAASLFAMAPVMAAEQAATATAEVKCEGVNACKGKGSCKGAHNACKGQNACKGKGFVNESKEACDADKAKMAAETKPAK